MQKLTTEQQTTEGIEIEVESTYVPEQSDPEKQNYFFSYTIRITNKGDKPAKLVSRHWIITDGFGRVREVEGPGVVGNQPRLEPGESFEYTSYCPLPTPTGTMSGSYTMTRDDGESFKARIPQFFLVEPNSYH